MQSLVTEEEVFVSHCLSHCSECGRTSSCWSSSLLGAWHSVRSFMTHHARPKVGTGQGFNPQGDADTRPKSAAERLLMSL